MATAITTLSGCRNLREVSGQSTAGGRTVRRSLLYRSDSLHHLRPIDADLVRRVVEPRTLVDLRSSAEVERDGLGPLAGTAAYVHLPLPPAGGRPPWEDAARPPDMLDLYLWLAEAGGTRLAALVKLLASPGALPAIVFCAAGKDRTGVAIATVLGCLGARDDDIVDDYAASGSVSPDRLPAESVLRRLPSEFRESRPQVMRAFLAAVRQGHGSVRAFVAHQGVRVGELVGLERALLEPQPTRPVT